MTNHIMPLAAEGTPADADLEVEIEEHDAEDYALLDRDDDHVSLAAGNEPDGSGDGDAADEDDDTAFLGEVTDKAVASRTGPSWFKSSFVEACEVALPKPHALQAGRTAVGYTRESTPDQTKTSQPRQLAAVRGYVKIARLKLRRIYTDQGVTGTSTYGRHQWQAMMAAARRKEFQVIVVEHLDRFGRSLPDVLRAWEELAELGIEIHDAKHGRLDLAHIVIMGYLGVDGRLRFLDLCKMGKRRAVAEGFVMQAPSYGYRRHRNGKRGIHEIVPDRAANVRRIIRWAGDGVGSKRIAVEMNRRGLHSPRQCCLLDAGEALDEVSRPWTGQEIRVILRNPLYSGWNVWGQTKSRMHRETKRLESREKRPQDDWVVAEVPRLRIVSEVDQARAIRSIASRSFGGASAPNRAGTRLLAGCVHCAKCGSPMHAKRHNGHFAYVCSDHIGQAADRCTVSATVRIEWVERAVVATLESRLLGVANDQAYRDRFASAFAAASEGRLRRIAELNRAIARINADLKASHVAAMRNINVDDEIIAEINQELRDRREQLVRIRVPLEDVARPAEAFRQLDGLNAGFAELAKSIPFRAIEPEGEVLAQRFRKLVGHVAVHPKDVEGVVRLDLVYDRDRVTKPLHYKVEKDAEARRLTICIDTVAERELELGLRRTQVYAKTLEAARSGLHRLDDAAFETARTIAAGVDLVVDGVAVDLRTLLDGVFCVLKTKGALSKPPTCYGDAGLFHRALRRLVRAHAWDAIVEAFRVSSPEILAGADLDRISDGVYPRGPKRDAGEAKPRLSKDGKAAQARVLRAAAEIEKDPTTKRRLEAVAMRLEGIKADAVSAATKLSVAAVYTLGSNHRHGGVDALRGAKSSISDRGAARDKRIPLTLEQDRRIAEIARPGVDRDGRKLKFAKLSEMCRAEGIVAGKWALDKALARQGIDLYAIVAPEKAASQKAGLEAARAKRRAEAGHGPQSVSKRKLDPKRRRGGHLLSRRYGIEIEAIAGEGRAVASFGRQRNAVDRTERSAPAVGLLHLPP